MNTQPRTLLGSLRRAYLATGLTAGIAAGVSFILIALITLYGLVSNNMHFIARSIAYSSEASVMFSDAETATEILEQIAHQEQLIEASIVTADGTTLAQYQHLATGTLDTLGAMLSHIIFPERISTTIMSGSNVLGYVYLRGNGTVFALFFLKTLGAVLICFILSVFAAIALARQMAQHITRQLDVLASLTHSVHIHKNFKNRLPGFEIFEFDQLGQDFNALLAEIETKNAELIARQAELEQANATLSLLALHDSLTGLANRTQFESRLIQAIESARSNDHYLGLLYIDSDHFKEINDRYGHAAGDALLIEVAKRISSVVRDTDLVARLGGDEFSIILSPLRCATDAELVTKKILEIMQQPITLSPQHKPFVQTLSIGVAVFPDHGNNSEALVRAADYAMYLAKNNGRNGYCVFNATTDRRSHNKIAQGI